MVLAAVTLPTLGDAAPRVPFLIDTGAALTILHPRDATTRLGFTRSQLEQPQSWPVQPTYGIGGTTTNYTLPARYTFSHEDGSLTEILGRILVARRTPENAELPSIMGWDLLRQIHLTMDWDTRTILLDPRSRSATS
ncbi:MAG: hypothetical protein HYX51_04600 [Chloroflexi bacterium]|nr:hypothetical protein [Chloroflexota bacterium]